VFPAVPTVATYHVVATSTEGGARVEVLVPRPVALHGLTLGAHYTFQVSSVNGDCVEGQPTTVALGSAALSLDNAALILDGGTPALAAQTGADGLTAGYFDPDGFPDLLTSKAMTQTLARFQGADGGAYVPLSPIPLTVRSPIGAMPVADFDGDAIDDVAFYDFSSTSVVFATAPTAAGSGAAVPMHSCTVNGVAVSAAAIDLVRSGHPQLAVLTQGLADGGANGAAHVTFVALAGSGCIAGLPLFVDGGADGLSTGDFDGDGSGDIAFTATAGGPVTLWFGDGDGGFPRQTTFGPVLEALGVQPVYYAADAGRGIVIDGPNSFQIMRPNGGGYMNVGNSANKASSGTVTQVVAADLDGDGLTELLWGNPISGSPSLQVWRPTVSGYQLTSAFDGGPTQGVAVVDVDGDHRLDVVTLESSMTQPWSGLRIRRGR
jgi:hypothetical protein